MKPARLVLKVGREKALLRRHPWVFSGAIHRVQGEPASGDTIRIEAGDGRFLGWGAFSPDSQIIARIWSFDESVPLAASLIQARVTNAVARRATHAASPAARLLHAEADGLPGVVCDRYDTLLVLQLTSSGAMRWRDEIVAALRAATGCTQVYERSDGDVLELEGLTPQIGALVGSTPETTIPIVEHALRFAVSAVHGHKTGFYLDQRDNRLLVQQHADGADVLDCFCYTGGFTVNALAGGAQRVTAIDSSADALEQARLHVALNGLNAERVEWVDDDVFKRLRTLRDQARKFDLIVLDPPKFAPTAALAERAARGYKDINLLAFKLLKPGGHLFTFSCSGGIHRDLFQKIIAGAAADAGRAVQVLRHLSASADHPVMLTFPEGDYLKGLLLKAIGE